MSLTDANNEVREALAMLVEELPGWVESERRREAGDNETASRERFLREFDYLRRLESPESWQMKRLELLGTGADIDRERLAELRAERKRHEEVTARLLKAERVIFRFADRCGIDAEPLMRLLVSRDLERGSDLTPVLRRVEDALDREGKVASTSAGTPGDQATVEQQLERVAQAVGDDNAATILAIAGRKDWPGERRMQEILRLDRRFAGKDSGQWGALLGVTPAAVRGYETWKAIRRAKESAD